MFAHCACKHVLICYLTNCPHCWCEKFLCDHPIFHHSLKHHLFKMIWISSAQLFDQFFQFIYLTPLASEIRLVAILNTVNCKSQFNLMILFNKESYKFVCVGIWRRYKRYIEKLICHCQIVFFSCEPMLSMNRYDG